MFYKASITLFPKPEKATARKEKYRSIFMISIDEKILNKISANKNSTAPKRIIPIDQV